MPLIAKTNFNCFVSEIMERTLSMQGGSQKVLRINQNKIVAQGTIELTTS